MAKLYKVEASIVVYLVSEDGSEPSWHEIERAVRDEVRDNPDGIDPGFAREVTSIKRVDGDWLDSIPRGTKDQRTIRERAAELFGE